MFNREAFNGLLWAYGRLLVLNEDEEVDITEELAAIRRAITEMAGFGAPAVTCDHACTSCGS